MTNDQCVNCGGSEGIHHYQTEQCPVGGREAPDGREQEWKTSTFAAAEIPFDPPHKLATNMTMREYFAAAALAAIIIVNKNTHGDQDAAQACDAADALIEALNK